MTKRAALALLLLLVAAQPVFAGFSDIASGLEREFGFRRTWIPFLSFARFAVWTVHPKGIHDFQLAVYEKTPEVDPLAIATMLQDRLPRGFSPLVRVHSRRGEWTFIYARPSNDGRIIELFVLAHENDETVLVRVAADAEIVTRQLDNPGKVKQVAMR